MNFVEKATQTQGKTVSQSSHKLIKISCIQSFPPANTTYKCINEATTVVNNRREILGTNLKNWKERNQNHKSEGREKWFYVETGERERDKP